MRGGPGCAIVQRTTGRGLMQLCRNNLADSLSGQGKYDEAEKMQREVLAVSKRVLGADHSNTLSTANNLAASLWSQGKQMRCRAPQHVENRGQSG
jgi:hypothetical protein